MKSVLIILLTLFSIQVSSQYYTSGSDPARLRWKQIKTPVVRVVFEESLQKEALRLAIFMDSIAPLISGTLNHRPKRVDLLVHNHTAYSNGFVTWAPRRTEFFAMPHQNLGSVDWLEHLAIHEYRHVVQIDKLKQGSTRFLSWIAGQQAIGAVLGIYLPMWFLEGDAVVTETTLTPSGRGRSFEFNSEIKAQLLEKGKFSYDKAYFGSYREHVPDYYKMGYLMTALARQEFGSELWENAITNTGRNSWLSNPFRRSIKKATGMNQKALYSQLFAKLQTDWKKEAENLHFTEFTPITSSGKDYLRYMHAVAINDSTVITEIKGPGIRSQIASVAIPTGETTPLVYTGMREAEPISANQKFITWSELQYHPRWEHKSWSVIRTYDLTSGKTRTLTSKSYFFAPTIHPHNNTIAALESSPSLEFFITLLDGESGKVLLRIPTPDNKFVLTPSWNQNGENLVCVLLSDKGKALFTLDPNSQNWARVSEYSFVEIRHPVQSGNFIWYTAKGATSDEIFRFDIETGEATPMASSRFGAMYPAITPDNKKLIYSHYTSNGYQLVQQDAHHGVNANPDHGKSLIDQLAQDLTQQESIPAAIPVDSSNYQIKPYSKWNLINLHSWAPVYADFDRQEIHTGVSVMSQNLLGTTIVTAGYNANPSASHEKYNIDITYRGWFPLIDLLIRKGDDTFKRDGFFSNSTDTFHINTSQKINYLYLKTGLRVPLDLSRGNYSRLISASARFSYQLRSEVSYLKSFYSLNNGTLVPTGNSEVETIQAINYKGMEYSLYFHNLRRGTSRDVATRYGQVVNITYRHTPWGNIRNGNITGISTKLYFPGLMRHHALSINNDFQITNQGNRLNGVGKYYHHHRYNNVLSSPRGYNTIYNDNMYIFRSTYMMPLWNPDASIGSLAYVKRVRISLFYDAAVARYTLTRRDNNLSESYRDTPASFGAEIHTDTHLLRFVLPFSTGYRIGYRTTDGSTFHEFILRTGFGGFLTSK
jgi:hypothetical protein